jgi:hypothetical protein
VVAFSAGQNLTAADLIKILPFGPTKQTDQTLNNGGGVGTTLQNDTELLASVSANISYKVLLDLIAKEAASQVTDIKIAFTMPTGCILDMLGGGPHTSWNASSANLEAEWAALQAQTTSPTSTFAFGTNTVPFTYRMTGQLRVGSTAGTFRVQWAQNTANAANLTVMAGSTLTLIPILT